MSLKEKLLQKRENKKVADVKISTENIDKVTEEMTTRREKIANLKQQLEFHYSQAPEIVENLSEKRDNRKKERQDIDDIYKENKDVLEEDGISDVEGMITANPNEEEVLEYKRASHQAEATVTELKKEVGSISEIKASLKEELPELDLKFTGGKKDEAENSNRDEAFIKIDEYLQGLDKKVLELKEEKESAHLETLEGKREDCLKTINADRVFSQVDSKRINNFHLSDNEMQLAEKHGADVVRQVITEQVQDKVEEDVFDKKSEQSKEAINGFPELKALSELKDLRQELKSIRELETKTLNHLKKIFAENEGAREQLSGYGLGGKDEDERTKRYLDHATNLNGLDRDTLDRLVASYESNQEEIANQDFTKNPISPEYFKDSFENYRKVFEYIINNVDENTMFVGSVYGEDKDKSLTNQFSSNKRGRENRKEIGLKDLNEDRDYKLDIPTKFIKQNGSFSQAWLEATRETNDWNQEKKKIGEVSQIAVDVRWANSWNEYYKKENQDVINELETSKNNLMDISYFLSRLEDLSPEERQRKIMINKGEELIDMTAQEEMEAHNEKLKELKQKRDDYLQGLIDQDKIKIEKIGTGFLSNKSKRVGLENRVAHFKNIKENDITEVNINDGATQQYFKLEEIDELNSVYSDKKVLNENYEAGKGKGKELQGVVRTLNIEDSTLYGETMTVDECIERMSQIRTESQEYVDNFPQEKQDVVDQVAKNEEEKKRTDDSYKSNAWKYKL